jgi:hypothetical protein
LCDPTVMTIASAVSLGLGAGGAAMNYFGQQDAQQQQEDAYTSWMKQQDKNRAAETARQDAERTKAIAAQKAGLDAISPGAQKQAQADEEARLTNYLQGGAQSETNPPVSIADRRLSGQGDQGAGGDQFQTDLAAKLNKATQDSRQRLAALARVSSYGGSEHGLDQTTSGALARAGSAIDLANSFRRGSLGAFNVAQAVQPRQITYNDQGLGGLSQTLMSAGAQGLGSSFANAYQPPVNYGTANLFV